MRTSSRSSAPVGLLNDDTTTVGAVHLGRGVRRGRRGTAGRDPRDGQAGRARLPSRTAVAAVCRRPRDVEPARFRRVLGGSRGRWIIRPEDPWACPRRLRACAVRDRPGRWAAVLAVSAGSSARRRWRADEGRRVPVLVADRRRRQRPGGLPRRGHPPGRRRRGARGRHPAEHAGWRLDATQRIVATLLEAQVPTIVWVAPSGGRAASAGTFITLAGARRAHGARHEHRRGVVGRRWRREPRPGDIRNKAFNDAMANIRGDRRGPRPERRLGGRGRPRRAGSAAVTRRSSSDVVDGLAGSIDDVLAFADGRTVTVAGAEVTLDLAGADVPRAADEPVPGRSSTCCPTRTSRSSC